MSHYLAQRGTKVALVEARSLSVAAPLAAKALRLPRSRPRRWCVTYDGEWQSDGRYTYRRRWVTAADPDVSSPRFDSWPFDWRGAKLRRATDAEVAEWIAAQAQARELRGLSRKAMRERAAS